MKPLLLGMFFCCCIAVPVSGQHSFLHSLQKKEAGQGTVNVHQSDDISRLVNGTPAGTKKTAARTTAAKTTEKQAAGRQQDKTAVHRKDSSRHAPSVKEKQKSETEKSREAEIRKELDSLRAREAAERKREVEVEQPRQTEADRQREKRDRYNAFVRAPKRRVRGFRVQVYAGDNTRSARQKAQSIAVQVKNYFPELAVYAHFVSPRWVCRVGDFKTYGEAQTYLRKIRAKKYREALIVKTTILVIAR